MTKLRARFIAADTGPDSAPLFRRDFQVAAGHGDVASATLSLSSLSVYEAWINGVAVSEDLHTPGCTSYEWRLHYVNLDVTTLIEAESTLGIAVGNGWYRGRLGCIETQRYGKEIAAFAELRLDPAQTSSVPAIAHG